MLKNLRIVDDKGKRVELVAIPAGKIQASQLAPGKGVPTLSSPNKSLAFRYGSSSGGIEVPFTFTDPNGARIGGCFSIRLKGQLVGPFGGGPMVAFASEPDGKTSGDFTLRILPGFDPPTSDADGFDYELDLTPVSAVDPTKEAIAEALAGNNIAAGTPITLAVHVGPTSTPSPSGGPTKCTSDSSCSAFGGRNCDPKDGARCGGDGLCHCCLALCSSSTNVCTCTGCDSNCSGDRMCVGTTCVFKVGRAPSQ